MRQLSPCPQRGVRARSPSVLDGRAPGPVAPGPARLHVTSRPLSDPRSPLLFSRRCRGWGPRAPRVSEGGARRVAARGWGWGWAWPRRGAGPGAWHVASTRARCSSAPSLSSWSRRRRPVAPLLSAGSWAGAAGGVWMGGRVASGRRVGQDPGLVRGAAGALLGGGHCPPSPLSTSVPCPQSLAGPWAGPSSAWTGSADRSAPTSLGTALRTPSCRSCLKAGLRAGPKPEQPGHSRHAFWVLPEDRPSFPVGPRVLLLAWISRGTHLPYPGSEQIEE